VQIAKKLNFESFKYQFLVAAQYEPYQPRNILSPDWTDFVRSINFTYEKDVIGIAWSFPTPNSMTVSLNEPKFYLRGDSHKTVSSQKKTGLLKVEDPIKLQNKIYFKRIVMRVAESAGYKTNDPPQTAHEKNIQIERDFHDAWADSANVEKIDVRASNEVCTAPEMRYIIQRLGNIKGKRLLDVGCGLGEASVYFAMLGANVTSCDLSQGMLDATSRLANLNGVRIKQHIASAENMQLPKEEKFDIIYAGNLLHHVDIEETIIRIKPHLDNGGMFVSWDPLAYNPAINVYRMVATDVRTPDEHPLKWDDIKLFHKHFGTVETKYYWLSTLIIFIIMALAQRRNPNKERFWKVIIQEGKKWKWLYQPLEKLDRLLLKISPPLKLICWNVVIVCKVERPL
jgi:2-polyprenyl-3-methyl-5-hydroxy-6-metoxy-1,4-benzoquinol methylase